MSLEATDWNLHLARLVYVNHVGHGTNDFTFKDAMILVGIHPDIAASPFYQRKLEHLKVGVDDNQRQTRATHNIKRQTRTTNNIDRSKVRMKESHDRIILPSIMGTPVE